MSIDRTNFTELYPTGYVCNPNISDCDCELCEIVRFTQQLQAENEKLEEKLAGKMRHEAFLKDIMVRQREANAKLTDAGRALYYAGHWTCDREVDEPKMWEDLRDAMGLPPGTERQHGSGKDRDIT